MCYKCIVMTFNYFQLKWMFNDGNGCLRKMSKIYKFLNSRIAAMIKYGF
jgi:hypothetical protein